MEGRVIQFRRGRHTVQNRHFLLDFGFKNRLEAATIVGKDIEWKSSSGKIIKGRIASAHGNNGIVRAIFEKGLPGQSIGTLVSSIGSTTVKPKKEKGEK